MCNITISYNDWEMNGVHGLILKSIIFEEAQRILFIFAGKGIEKNKVYSNSLVCNGLDFIPTICDLTGIEILKDLIGISLKPQFTEMDIPSKRNYLITENFNSCQITDGSYKLTLYELSNNPEFLVDIKVDLREDINLAMDIEHDGIKQKFKQKLYRYL